MRTYCRYVQICERAYECIKNNSIRSSFRLKQNPSRAYTAQHNAKQYTRSIYICMRLIQMFRFKPIPSINATSNLYWYQSRVRLIWCTVLCAMHITSSYSLIRLSVSNNATLFRSFVSTPHHGEQMPYKPFVTFVIVPSLFFRSLFLRNIQSVAHFHFMFFHLCSLNWSFLASIWLHQDEREKNI